ncbi:MAG: S41 family peptidase [Synechococcales bacterium]|nr:S41 family peptidase [Synechococcales bacterium]
MTKFYNLSQLLRQLMVGTTIAATSTALSITLPVFSPSGEAALQNSPKMVLDEAWQIVNREYVDGSFNQTDWQEVRRELLENEYPSNEAAYEALRDALKQLDDPYTRFLDPEQYEELSNQTSGEFSGIGLRLQIDEETGVLTIVEPLENSPATAAGLQAGDRILEIEGQSTVGMTVQDASQLIRGEAGTEVMLRVDRDDQGEFEVAVMRARLEVPTVAHALREEGDLKIGYIRLSEFSAHAAEQMQVAIRELVEQDVDAFVLDLRGNPGGLLQSSIDISRMWLDSGAIVQTINRQGDSEQVFADHTSLTDRPLAVLVDNNSASSSEILTGALLDNRRATVVGTQTFGKALVQRVHGLSDGSGLAVTVAHYYTPDGTDISHRGITPDIELELTRHEQQQLSANPNLRGTFVDPHYREALTALQPEILAHRRHRSLFQSLGVAE